MNLEKVWAMSLKLVTINIEGNRHLARWPRIVPEEQPDVVCMQEVFEKDLPYIEEKLQMKGSFFPMMNIAQENKYGISPAGLWGVGLFTNLTHSPIQGEYYSGTNKVKIFVLPNDASRVLVSSTVEKDGEQFTVATTHFTWSGKGETTAEQLADFSQLKQIVEKKNEVILCGDFNAPRGRELFSKFTEILHDNLPADVTTTLDETLHYAGKLDLVVDTIFTSPQYRAEKVHTIAGVSDHMAVAGEISRTAALN